MVLAMNIGNTNITWARRDGGMIHTVRRLSREFTTKQDFVDGMMVALKELGTAPPEIDGVVVASVVPDLLRSFQLAAVELLGIEPLIVRAQAGIKMKTDLSTYDTTLLGSDRIAVCEAATSGYTLPTVVFDFGTATTINVVDTKGCFLGGSILPGVTMSLRALSKNTALLPENESYTVTGLIGRNTADCINSGVICGGAAMLDGMAERIEAELGRKVTVLATGGHAGYIIPFCRTEVIHVPNLLIEGLFNIFQENS